METMKEMQPIEDLLHAVSEVGMMRLEAAVPGATFMFDTSNASVVSAAQRVLLDRDYRLERVPMVEGSFYLFKFRSRGNLYPYSIGLRYLNVTQFAPPLGLFYYEDHILRRWTRETARSEDQMKKMLQMLLLSKTGQYQPLWIPLLQDTPFIEF